ncbi:MAG: TetR/AcrR family transcriptional regulator C-terminal domain-containing protein [Chloroflexi bacterium]|nr:TetR/AcrR family transcriptional regulator C-terminal domain-containing protein [Chloroflexota bacterium]
MAVVARVRRPLDDVSLAWAAPSPRRPPLDREQLIQAALALLDAVGFDGLTMRRLAERLGVQAASLYNHVRDKQQLLTLLADAICRDVPSLQPARPWREQLEQAARDLRRVLLAHRDAARVLMATPPVGPNRLRTIEQVLAVLRAAGFVDRDVADAGWVLNSYVTGFVFDEQVQATPTAPETRAQIEQLFRSLPAERYPTLAALAGALTDPDLSQRFEYGLELMLDGLEARRPGRSPRRRAHP